MSDPLIVVAALAEVFDALGIPYLVGGSLASSLYGIPRATLDADLMADVRSSHVAPLTEALEGDFYVAAELISDAVRHRSSFNVIHLATMFKADILCLGTMNGRARKSFGRGPKAFRWLVLIELSVFRVPKTRFCTSFSGIDSVETYLTTMDGHTRHSEDPGRITGLALSSEIRSSLECHGSS